MLAIYIISGVVGYLLCATVVYGVASSERFMGKPMDSEVGCAWFLCSFWIIWLPLEGIKWLVTTVFGKLANAITKYLDSRSS